MRSEDAPGPGGADVRSLLAITWKDLRLIARDRAAILFLVLVPFVVVTVLAESLAGSDTGSLLLPVVNEDQGPVGSGPDPSAVRVRQRRGGGSGRGGVPRRRQEDCAGGHRRARAHEQALSGDPSLDAPAAHRPRQGSGGRGRQSLPAARRPQGRGDRRPPLRGAPRHGGAQPHGVAQQHSAGRAERARLQRDVRDDGRALRRRLRAARRARVGSDHAAADRSDPAHVGPGRQAARPLPRRPRTARAALPLRPPGLRSLPRQRARRARVWS